MQRHAGILQKHLDEILERKCRAEDVDTKPGMMRILKKRVNEVEKEIAKENRKETNESTIKPYISMYKGKDGKQVYDVLDKNEKSAYKTSDERLAQHFFKKNYDKLREAPVQEDDMQDLTISDLEAQLGKINDEITFLQIDQKDKESALAALGELRSVLDKYQSQKESAVQEDISDKGRIALEKAGFDPMKVKEYMAVFNDHGDTSDID